jgi:class 3 adenylate cyclase
VIPSDGTRPPRWAFSFSAKLLTALLAAVGLVLIITLVVVRQQTTAQVHAATSRMIEQSRHAFREMEAIQRLEIGRVGRAFTTSPRTSAALEAALESGDMHWLAETARYELALNMLPQSLAVFTDAAGDPVITLIDGTPVPGDVAYVRRLVARLEAERARELLAYRVVDGRLYLLQLQPLDFDGHLIGTVAFGLPIDDDDAGELGAMLGAELCFVAGDRCIAGSANADDVTRRLLIDHTRRSRSTVVERADGRWLLVADTIRAAEPVDVWRAMSVPIEPVLRPFSQIERALYLTGAGALGLAILLGVLLSRGLTRPVRALVAATVRVGRGDYSTRVPVVRRDELGVLGEAFNTMTEGLLLKERYRGVLDKVVSPEVAEDLMKGELELGGETREVTTLFADITAFSDLVDGMEPQGVITLLNECMARLDTIVQSHNGVVDKYIGDEIMVIFGAPIVRADHVSNAVETALDMHEAMRTWNVERARRGEAPVSLSIGIHTGEAVAGNMGSPNRLNYTVVGDAVNLTKRLCGAAAPGQVLLTESTWKRIEDDPTRNVHAQPLGSRSFKGFAERYRVVAVERRSNSHATSVLRLQRLLTAPLLAGTLLSGALFAGTPEPLHAQPGGLPTLESLGLHYSSPAGAVQLALSGRLDLEGYAPDDEPTWLIPTTNAFVAGRARLFADLFVGERVYGLVELRADRGHAPSDGRLEARFEQVFLRFRPLARPVVALQAGKFASPFGAYAARHHTAADPLIRPPLPYDQRTLVAPNVVPGGLDGFLGWKDEARDRRVDGAPVVWDVPYPWGALATFGIGKLGARFAVLGSAPSGAPETWELAERRLRHPNVMAGLAYPIVPALTLGAAWNRGPYLEPLISGTLPAGAALEDFVQETVAFDAAYERGRTSLRAELFLNRWEVPNLPEDPLDTSFYVEGTTHLSAGLFLAARYGEIRYSRMGEDSLAVPWDLDQRRLQLGGGYRIVHNAEIRAEYLINDTAGAADPRDNLLSVQVWWAF